MVITDEYKHVAYGPCRVLSVHGFNNNSGADRYLQFHTKFPDALTNGDVPTFKSLWFPSGAATVFGRETFGDMGLSFSELLAAVSSTEVNYTAVTNTGLDLTIVVETECYYDSTCSIVGDLVTGVDSKQIWAIASGPKRLLRLDIYNAGVATIYPFIQASNSVVTAIASGVTKFIPRVLTTETKTYHFIPKGGQVENYAAASGVLQKGCIVGCATAITSGVITESTSTDRAIRAVVSSVL